MAQGRPTGAFSPARERKMNDLARAAAARIGSGEPRPKCSYSNPPVCFYPAHGGETRFHRELAKRTQLRLDLREVTGQQYGDATVSEDHPGASPLTGYIWELRRSAGKIVAIEGMISQLRTEEIGWGLASQEEQEGDDVPGGAGSYNRRTYEAKLNNWVELGLRERHHYADLIKIGITAGFEDRRLRIQEILVQQVNGLISNVLSQHGVDPSDPAVRRTVHQESSWRSAQAGSPSNERAGQGLGHARRCPGRHSHSVGSPASTRSRIQRGGGVARDRARRN